MPAWSTSRPTGRTGSTPPAGRGSPTDSAGRPASWPRPAPGWASTCCSRRTTCTTSGASLDDALDLGRADITLLRPKGDWARAHWPGFPCDRDLDAAAAGIRAFVASRPAVRLYVDTALRGEWAELGLFEDPEPEVAGCGGGQRHVAVTPEGDVFPCSHARHAPSIAWATSWPMSSIGSGREGPGIRLAGPTSSDCRGVRCACRIGAEGP